MKLSLIHICPPDMKLPIQYALYYPERRYRRCERLDFKKLREITFDVPDMDTFRGLPMAMEASRIGGSMLTVFKMCIRDRVYATYEGIGTKEDPCLS